VEEAVHFNERLLGAARARAGLAMRPRPESEDLLIFMQGGNGCFFEAGCNATAHPHGFEGDPWCAMNTYPGQDRCDLAAHKPLEEDNRLPVDYHIFADSEENPFNGWNYVFIPYVSGDFMAGDNPHDVLLGDDKTYGQLADSPDDAPTTTSREQPKFRRFRGRSNMLAYLARIVPTFPHVKRVVVSGYSAGGMGALFHFDRVTRAFRSQNPAVETSLLVDSAVLLRDDDFPACLQRRARDVYRLDRGMPADCEGCFSADGTYTEAYLRWLLDRYAATHEIGFVVSALDPNIAAVHLLGATSEDRNGDFVPCGKLDYMLGPRIADLAEFAAAAAAHYPKSVAALHRARSFMCSHRSLRDGQLAPSRASMLIVPDQRHVWSRSALLDDTKNAASVRAYIREFLDGRPGSAMGCR
jgi:hypothetical protein